MTDGISESDYLWIHILQLGSKFGAVVNTMQKK